MKLREYRVQGRNGYWGVDEYRDGGMVRCVEAFNTRKLANKVAAELSNAVYYFCVDNGITYLMSD